VRYKKPFWNRWGWGEPSESFTGLQRINRNPLTQMEGNFVWKKNSPAVIQKKDGYTTRFAQNQIKNVTSSWPKSIEGGREGFSSVVKT